MKWTVTNLTVQLVSFIHWCHLLIVNRVQWHHAQSHHQLPMPLEQPRLLLHIHRRDARSIIWPPPAYIKPVYAPLGGLWKRLLRERPSFLIHEAGSPLIQLLFNLRGGAIFSHVKVTVTPPSASAVTRDYLLHPLPDEVTPGVRWGSMWSWRQLKTSHKLATNAEPLVTAHKLANWKKITVVNNSCYILVKWVWQPTTTPKRLELGTAAVVDVVRENSCS